MPDFFLLPQRFLNQTDASINNAGSTDLILKHHISIKKNKKTNK